MFKFTLHDDRETDKNKTRQQAYREHNVHPQIIHHDIKINEINIK